MLLKYVDCKGVDASRRGDTFTEFPHGQKNRAQLGIAAVVEDDVFATGLAMKSSGGVVGGRRSGHGGERERGKINLQRIGASGSGAEREVFLGYVFVVAVAAILG